MRSQFRYRCGDRSPRKIGGRCGDEHATACDLAGHQALVFDPADTDGDVPTFFDEIDGTIAQAQIDTQCRVQFGELSQ
ncbi:hypothetical protein D3C79_978380 [compost metagenome]